jgi:hypothetical protein
MINKITIEKNLKIVKHAFKEYDLEVVRNYDNTFSLIREDGYELTNNDDNYMSLKLPTTLLEHRIKIIKRHMNG